MMKRIHILLPEETITEVERLRGDTAQSAWIRRAVDQRIEKDRLDHYTGVLADAQGESALYLHGADPLDNQKAV
jgi:hypothetical protein